MVNGLDEMPALSSSAGPALVRPSLAFEALALAQDQIRPVSKDGSAEYEKSPASSLAKAREHATPAPHTQNK